MESSEQTRPAFSSLLAPFFFRSTPSPGLARILGVFRAPRIGHKETHLVVSLELLGDCAGEVWLAPEREPDRLARAGEILSSCAAAAR